MEHRFNLLKAPIEPGVVEYLPESIARGYNVLPVRRDDHGLHVIVPNTSAADTDDVLEKLRFALKIPVVNAGTAEAGAIAEAVNFHYSRIYAEIENCSVMFRFRCPMKWSSLESTEDDRIHYCRECSRNVYLCLSESDLTECAAKGRCVAVLREHDTLGMLDSP